VGSVFVLPRVSVTAVRPEQGFTPLRANVCLRRFWSGTPLSQLTNDGACSGKFKAMALFFGFFQARSGPRSKGPKVHPHICGWTVDRTRQAAWASGMTSSSTDWTSGWTCERPAGRRPKMPPGRWTQSNPTNSASRHFLVDTAPGGYWHPAENFDLTRLRPRTGFPAEPNRRGSWRD